MGLDGKILARDGYITVTEGSDIDLTVVADWFWSLYKEYGIRLMCCGYDYLRHLHRRLRQVAKRCVVHGQRVQNSVFECSLDTAQYKLLQSELRQLIEANELPQVCFHSLRHSSITYKLKLNGGDIKAVQGDSGHAQATMVRDQYSHILDESRRNNAQLFEQAFYGGKGVKIVPEAQDKAVEVQVQQAGLNSEVLLKIFSNPDMVAMLKMLAKTLG